MDSAHGNASIEHANTHIGAGTVRGDELPKPGNEPMHDQDARCSSSSSSDTSSEEDFFQLDAIELSNATATHDGANAQSEAAVIDSTGKQEVKNPSQEESMLVGAKQSPPVQVMGKSDGFDPDRIPSSIFTRTKSTAPMEWSVASNESLFSIQMGRSGELTGLYNNGQWDGYPSISPLPVSGPANNVGTGLGLEEPSVAEAANAEAMKDVLRAAAEEKGNPLTGGMPHSDSKRSDSSVNSYRSFAFPILTDGKNGSIKVESVRQHTPKEQPRQPQPQTESPKAVPVAAANKWFPCFSCCPFCC
uniref:Uncharacterized protein LOC105040476 n=1 Tax=Elaeis guineensis var. tenera TaxID=51953 RepID=A0A6J0PG28_ELAGV|nr:uncharacterized protein LOC105040476 [Elaeis guineensis]XP_010915320.1 uncharacterized protein LOC105040476 [Elaeis guineensis]XP_010915322.1 uncharacterized protein LOC105040476 [Elaeis guineensis]XP_019704537.1 uncharacterized protein LOC105040476 [Elaeis guineensis]XP_019704538.1 uncharacterized protein LOC105040476 [Elaeis guineensis]XP_029119026.1 uncharacterized protein LOC105040476 [Elaeis guineensis]